MKAMETVPEQEIEYRIRKFQLSLQEMDLDGAFILQTRTFSTFQELSSPLSSLFLGRENQSSWSKRAYRGCNMNLP